MNRHRLWQHNQLISWIDCRCKKCGRFIKARAGKKYCSECYLKNKIRLMKSYVEPRIIATIIKRLINQSIMEAIGFHIHLRRVL